MNLKKFKFKSTKNKFLIFYLEHILMNHQVLITMGPQGMLILKRTSQVFPKDFFGPLIILEIWEYFRFI